MNNSEHNLRKLRDIALNREEKSYSRNILLEHIIHETPHTSRFFVFLSSLRFYAIPAALAVLLVIGAGIIRIAESAVPGDAIYSVKIEVSEPLRDAVTFSTEDQVQWDITKAERRQEEIEKLAMDNGI